MGFTLPALVLQHIVTSAKTATIKLRFDVQNSDTEELALNETICVKMIGQLPQTVTHLPGQSWHSPWRSLTQVLKVPLSALPGEFRSAIFYMF